MSFVRKTPTHPTGGYRSHEENISRAQSATLPKQGIEVEACCFVSAAGNERLRSQEAEKS
ncbi:hypothetical protein HETIRDRAFT_423133 [Heterobasidion irregulare TC 32-1]|uniref:Uncharacterized protein n=1 Tax=Heterobasidion irregulare (strain TC 32-1) TaxID=747525 RepID=W4JPE7_HETIT|nr:uncharacterized protein HETIRDRAFT_423133 [Heterobasidion irregulare TC 32-1]ETW75442.1 hypothetical protein HETIRDRAFT_423133 [Heterobasidion irregulare TC 32-1]